MKKQEKTEKTRLRILEAAICEFGEKGYRGATVNSICRNYSIPKGLLYHNFSGKEELFLCCAERCFQDMTAYFSLKNGTVDPEEYLSWRYGYFKENPDYARIFFESVLRPPKELAGRLKELKRPFDEKNREIYCQALEHLELRNGVTKEDALEYYSLVQEMFNGYFSNPSYGEENPVQIMEVHERGLAKLLDLMLYGIAKKEE